MHQNDNKLTKKDLLLVVVTAIAAVMFTIMGAPLVRVLAKTKNILFWVTGIVLVSLLFLTKSNLIAIYVGAVWMTLGLYSEFENHGVNWKKSTAASVLSGVVFGVASFLLITHRSSDQELVRQIVDPIMNSLKQFQPEFKIEDINIMRLMPGVLASSLVCAIAASFALEAQAFQLFSLKREKVVSALRWLEFRTPDVFVWVSLFSFLFSILEISIPYLNVVAMNMALLSVVVYFFQGLAVTEFATRIYRFGMLTKLSLYFLIVLWAMPLVIVVGFADYWLDFRKMMRKRIKV